MGLKVPPGEFLRYPGADGRVSSTLEAYQGARSLSHLGRWRDQDKVKAVKLKRRKTPGVGAHAACANSHVGVAFPPAGCHAFTSPEIASVQRARSILHVCSSRAPDFEPCSCFQYARIHARLFSGANRLSLLCILSGGQTTTAGVALTQWLVSNCFCGFTCDFIGANKNPWRC